MITEKHLQSLREKIKSELSEKRATHILEVEKMVSRLALLYCPEHEMELRLSALLHDITKEKSTEEQISLCQEFHIPVTKEMLLAPKTFHAMTASELIKRDYAELVNPLIVFAVRYHTTGRENMTLTESLLYLADYIDMSRKFEDCIKLRNFFFDANPQEMSMQNRLKHLRKTLIYSFQITILDLAKEGKVIAPDTFLAYNQLLKEDSEENL